MNFNSIFFNQSLDKKRLKALVEWVLKTFGEKEALRVIEELKTTGFRNATQAGISLGLHELTTPPEKNFLISKAGVTIKRTDQNFDGARISATEKSQRIVDTWHRVSETLRKQVVDHFSNYDQLNPIYIMALSGARGNFSQVRQLVGMRGLMADPQGKIISFPIRSNLREGLTLTEYFISCSGARKGLVDTALRTADTGYLTRRLVDVSHHVVIKRIACDTHRGILISGLQSNNKTLLSLKERLIGRVLAEQVHIDSPKMCNIVKKTMLRAEINNILDLTSQGEKLKHSEKRSEPNKKNSKVQLKGLVEIIAKKDHEISPSLASLITQVRKKVLIRSPLTCALNHELCQLCYGWSLSHGSLVSLGEAVGVIAAQSIGEPGTQLTMRTFHTGGVFSGDLLQEIRAPHSGKISFTRAFQGLLVRTTHGQIAFLTKSAGEIIINAESIKTIAKKAKKMAYGIDLNPATDIQVEGQETRLPFQSLSMLFVRQGEFVNKNQLLAEISDLGEEGNQPIKSQQTVFAQLSGKIVNMQGGGFKNKLLDEGLQKASSSKKASKTQLLKGGFQKKSRLKELSFSNSLPLVKSFESLDRTGAIFAKSLNLQGKDSDEENQTINQIEPERSGKLGMFQILSTRIGATLQTCVKAQNKSALKEFETNWNEKRIFNNLKARTQIFHPIFKVDPLYPAKMTFKGYFPIAAQISLESDKQDQKRFKEIGHTILKGRKSAFLPLNRKNKLSQRSFCSINMLSQENSRHRFSTLYASAQTVICINKQQHFAPLLQKSSLLKSAWGGTQKKHVLSYKFRLHKINKEVHKNVQTVAKMFDLIQKKSQHFSLSTQCQNSAKANTLRVAATWPLPKLALSLSKSNTKKLTNKVSNGVLEPGWAHLQPISRRPVLLCKPRTRFTKILSASAQRKNLRESTCFNLNTIAHEGDLVNEDYKNFAPLL